MNKPNNIDILNQKNYFEKEIKKNIERYNFKGGYKLLYCPWKSIVTMDTAFISLNPGRAPDDAELDEISDERGNSYVVEEKITKSPITIQYLKLCKLIKQDPKEILTGVICPFRGDGWKDFNQDQKKIGKEIGNEFWSLALGNHVRLIITSGNEAGQIIKEMFDFELEESIASGWGKIKLRRFRSNNGVRLIQLPHLSRHKLLSRAQCIGPLREIFDVIDNINDQHPIPDTRDSQKRDDINDQHPIPDTRDSQKRKAHEIGEQNMSYHPKDIFKLIPGALNKVRAEHNRARINWIGEKGKIFSEINESNSVYRQNIVRPNYSDNSDIKQDLDYDIETKFLDYIPYI